MKLLSKFKQFSSRNKVELKLNNSKPLQGEELDRVLISSLNAVQEKAYLNSYETGLTKEGLETLVHHYWRIRDREGALVILDHLVERNRNKSLRIIYEAYEYEDFADYLKFRLPEDNEDVVKRYIAYLDKLHEIVPKMTEQNFFKDYAQVKKCQDAGWNLGQGAFLARCFFDLGYIQENELKRVLNKFYQNLKTYCSTWQEYTSSYILGRALEDWPDQEKVILETDKLQTHQTSPLKGKKYI